MTPSRTIHNRKDCIWEAVCLLIFIVIALAYACGRIGLHFNDFLLSTSDAANISSFSAALDHPELYAGDALLNNPANFAFYSTIHLPLIRMMAKWFGNYSTPFAFLIFPLTFLHLLGYNWLGREVTRDRSWSLIFSLMVLIPVQLNLSEIWGLWRDMIPRFLFQSLLPFVLAAVIRWGKNPRSWPWLMAAVGLLVYAHPVSLPAWGLAVLLSLWLLSPVIPLKQKLMRIFLAALVFVLVIAPFTVNYLSTTTFGTRGILAYSEIMTIMRKRFITGFLDLNIAFKDFIKIVVVSDWLMIFLWGFMVIGGLVLFILKRGKTDPILFVLAAWWFGIFIVSVVIPIIDHSLANKLQRMPLEVDLVRNLRFSIPLLLLTVFYLLSQFRLLIVKTTFIKSVKVMFFISILLSGLLLTGWILRNDFIHDSAFFQTARCWSTGRLVCPFLEEEKIQQQLGLLDAVKALTPPGSRIMAATDTSELMVRYYALRPLVYSYKDGAAFIYTNHKDLLTWWHQFQEISRIQALNTRNSFLDVLVAFASEYNADYLILNEEYDSQKYYPQGINNVYSNSGFSLSKLTKEE
jgi:hypothetical protein